MKLFKRKNKAVSEPKTRYYSTSEYVSSGHTDRLADNLAAIVINDIQHKDGFASHAAVEVFITHDTVYFGGEVKTSLKIDSEYLKGVVQKGFLRSGYIPEMRQYWTKKEVMLADDMKIVNKICAQSPDIAICTTDKGDESGWNDQGVFFSSCEDTHVTGFGTAHMVAKTISDDLAEYSKDTILGNNYIKLGPDNKVLITVKVDEDGFTPICVTAVTIAVAHSSDSEVEKVRQAIRSRAVYVMRELNIPVANECQWVINGTGRFVVHGCISDTSMTGRKISVNHPSAGPVWCNKMIGGESLVKPLHASDFLLNIMSRYIAEVVVASGLSSYAVVGCSCSIGASGLQSLFIKGDERFERMNKEKIYKYFFQFVRWTPKGIVDKFKLDDESFDFGMVVNENFFGNPTYQPWEDPKLFLEDAETLWKWMKILH